MNEERPSYEWTVSFQIAKIIAQLRRRTLYRDSLSLSLEADNRFDDYIVIMDTL